MDRSELAQNAGKDGKPAYVAANGKVYDVTDSKLWKNGKHMNRHEAGNDLTADLAAAPHGMDVFGKFKEVGELEAEKESVEMPIPKWLANFMEANPFFKRHPHPMVVHFPMVFFIMIPLFLAWYYIISPLPSMLDTIFYLQIIGTLSLPAAMLTGWLSWKVNYFGKPTKQVSRKIAFSIVLLIFSVVVLVALILNPNLLAAPGGLEFIIPVLIFCYLPIVSFIGQQGGLLVYPTH